MSFHLNKNQILMTDETGQLVWADPPFDKAELVPSEEQLEKHPTLKQAWDEYIVIRKLLGL